MSSCDKTPEGQLPNRPFMTISELVNWVAFARAVDWDIRGRSELVAKWSVRELGNLASSAGLAGLLELAGGAPAWLPPPEMRHPGRIPAHCQLPGWWLNVRAMARAAVADLGRSASDLADELAADLKWEKDRNERHAASTSEALETIYAGKLAATGFPPASEGSYGPAGYRAPLPPRWFDKAGLTVMAGGVVYEPPADWHELPGEKVVLLDVHVPTKVVEKLWKPVPPDQEEKEANALRLIQADIDKHRRNGSTRYAVKDNATAIARQAGTTVVRTIEIIRDQLPEEWRHGRGRPAKA